jgi:hypothetical protein
MVYVSVDVNLREFDDAELIEELEDRGKFTVVPNDEINSDLYKIRQAYLLESPDEFRKTIERMLSAAGMPV